MKLMQSVRPDGWSLAAFLLPMAVYLWCLAPSISFYDSGEFVTAVHLLGSAHSPGYPMFLLYAKPFTWLPVGNIAFRVNLATAVSAALACWATYQLIFSLLKDQTCCLSSAVSQLAIRLAALSGALLFAFSPRLWLQSNHDKPYPLLAFITALMLLCLLRWQDAYKKGLEQPAWWYALAFLGGLATGAHQTIVLVLPGAMLFVLSVDRAMVRRIREWLLSIGFLLLGGAVQLYLPIRAAANAGQNWGDPDVLSRFLWHLLRKGYPEQPHGRDFSLLLKQLGGFDLLREFSMVGLVLLAAGVWLFWRHNRALLVYIMSAVLCFWLVIVGHFNPVQESIFLTEEFYTPLYLLAAVLIGSGLFALVQYGVASAKMPDTFDWRHNGLLILLFLLVPFFQLVVNFTDQNQHRNYLAQDYAVNSLRPLPDGAVLFTWGDSGAFPLWYLHDVERLREDVVIPHIPHLAFQWYLDQQPVIARVIGHPKAGMAAEDLLKHLLAKLQSNSLVMFDFSTRHSISWGNQQPLQRGIVFYPGGSRIHSLDEDIWRLYALHRFQAEDWKPDEDSVKAQVIHAYCLMQAAEDLARQGHQREARRLLVATEAIMPGWRDSLRQMQKRYGITVDSRKER